MNEDAEIFDQQLLTLLFVEYGYDFSKYSKLHTNRRILDWLRKKNIEANESTLALIRSDKNLAYSLINHFSVGVTEMFRDPLFYKSLREKVIPFLKTNPFIKIWHAGCSTGEEVYSLAIILDEENLLNRCRIYATDINENSLKKARLGIYPRSKIQDWNEKYMNTGGLGNFSHFYTSDQNSVIFKSKLKKNIVWANHNLVEDQVFSEMDLIVCRNVFIYFSKELQNSVLELFRGSLSSNSYLCLGQIETLQFSSVRNDFQIVDPKFKIYKALK